MNSLSFAKSACRPLFVRSVARMEAEDAAELLDALNGALQEWFAKLPPHRKQGEDAFTIHAPASLQIDILTGSKAFAYVATHPFPLGTYGSESELLGQACLIQGDSHLNRLHRSSELLRPFLGSGGDSLTATFYSDAIGLGPLHTRLTDRPLYRSATCTRELELLPNPPSRLYPFDHGLHLAEPTHYYTKPIHPADGTSPFWILGLWPLPTVVASLTATIETTTPVLRMEDLQTATFIPVPDHEAHHLHALAHSRLVASRLWHKDSPTAPITEAAERARHYLTVTLDTPHHSEPSQVGTPENF